MQYNYSSSVLIQITASSMFLLSVACDVTYRCHHWPPQHPPPPPFPRPPLWAHRPPRPWGRPGTLWRPPPSRLLWDNSDEYLPTLSTPSTPLTTTRPTTTSTSGAPIAIPNGSIILPNGSTKFPNGTVLPTRYADDTVRPAALLPSGAIRFSNGTIIPQGTSKGATFPPPGIPLNATDGNLIDPPLYLPYGTVIFLNGSLWTPGYKRISTVFIGPTKANCGGVVCQHLNTEKLRKDDFTKHVSFNVI